MEEKLREVFEEMAVYKDLKTSNFLKTLGLPSFLRDWLLRKFEDDEGQFDIAELQEFVRTYFPRQDEWTKIKDQIMFENERVSILTKIIVSIEIKTQAVTFELPAFGLTPKETIIESDVWNDVKCVLRCRDILKTMAPLLWVHTAELVRLDLFFWGILIKKSWTNISLCSETFLVFLESTERCLTGSTDSSKGGIYRR